MRAAKLYDVKDLRVEDLADPNPGVDEVVVKVMACGVCATDVNMWRGTSDEGDFPFVPGHKWSGEFVEVGSAVTDSRDGDRVVQAAASVAGIPIPAFGAATGAAGTTI